MKLNTTPRVNVDAETARWYREIATQVNTLSEGSIVARYNAATSAPAAGNYTLGDRIANSAPSELGTAGSKYVVTDFLCTVSGAPGTWVSLRSLTGN